ncbi:MAG: 4-(cytidine 5'-diphospho)-2-C-methyl-D-erythritol kinase, partial [Gemmatimonadota bacterium]|nr:4-(cytidine 5'-diphospho)-2-C-methyl-D-erythritol kinase [Gemmatimonadota bacterium]
MSEPVAANALALRAPAKVNLDLRVLGVRPDGYHEIETLLVRLHIADRIELRPGPRGLRLHSAGSDAGLVEGLPSGEENLCCRAARIFFRALGREPALTIRLEKRIPIAAGLGGGSSDAAAVLGGLNRRAGAPFARERILEMAAELGSDVPFFALDQPAAVARGRGERLESVAPPPSRPVLIVVPDFGVSAAEAYRWWDAGPPGDPGETPRWTGTEGPPSWREIAHAARNDLAPGVERRHPILARVRANLAETGAAPALLCGSGSCVAGVFDTEAERDAAGRRLAAESDLPDGWRLIETR